MRQLKITKQITERDTDSLNYYLNEVNSKPLLTIEEEETLPLLIKQGDDKALTRFVEGNLRFVISVAKQYKYSGTSLCDLINVGNEGLIVAAKRFDTTKGFKFISYGVWWIRQSILKYLSDNGNSIRLPANKIYVLNRVKSVISSL